MKRRIGLIMGVLLTLITFTMCDKKEYNIDNVKFELIHSKRIPNNKVTVEIKKSNSEHVLHLHSEPMQGEQGWENTRIDTSFTIEINIFNKISRDLTNLINSDFSKSTDRGFDGTECSIMFEYDNQRKEYNFWTPDYDTEKRGLTEYLKVCKLIIETAGLKTEGIL